MRLNKNKIPVSQEVRTRARKLKLRSIRRNWLLYLFVLPAMIYYIVFHYIPIYGIQIAFQNYKVGEVFGESQWIGFDHFIRFFNSAWFSTVMKNTMTISILSLVINFPLPIILALMLNEVKNLKIRKIVQTVTYAPHFISTVVLCGAITMFLSPSTGLLGMTVNNIRESMGLNAINISSIGSAFKWIYVLSGTWQGVGWGSVIYFAALSGVDMQLVEAAEVDGANRLQCIWHIHIPAIMPTIIIQLILQCGHILSVGYEKVYLLQNDTILMSSEVISTYVYRVGLMGAQYSFSTAVNLFNSLINVAMLVLVNTIIRKVSNENSLW